MKIPTILFFLPLFAIGAPLLPDNALLLRECLRYEMAAQVSAQEPSLLEVCTPEDAPQVKAALAEWRDFQLSLLRDHVQKRFGEDARQKFSVFMDAFANAERQQNGNVLKGLARDMGMAEPPEDYAALRRHCLDAHLAAPIAEASRLLGEIQTWGPLRAHRPDVPELDLWLQRDRKPAAPIPTPPAANPLRDAEASEAWVPPANGANPMDAFADKRRQRRDQALADANAGMEQVARERETAEQEAAARKLADAQADAEAMRAQAQRLAATEQEALAQRENSWGNRLKRVVGATLSATTGAFTGGIGAEAGRRAAEEVFK